MFAHRFTLLATCLALAPLASIGQTSALLALPSDELAASSAGQPTAAVAFSTSAPDGPLPDSPSVVAGLAAGAPQQPTSKPQPPLQASVPTATPGHVEYPLASGQVYRQPTQGELVRYYLRSTFGATGQAAVAVRALFQQALDTPDGWDQNWTGFGQRFGSNEGVTFINQTVKFALSDAFHEDFRYFRCQGCTWGKKIDNVLLAEVTARHGEEGRRKPSITPIASHISGTVVAHHVWYPDQNDTVHDAVSSVAIVLATQVGIHVFEEFFLRHAQEKLPPVIGKRLPGAKPPKPITD